MAQANLYAAAKKSSRRVILRHLLASVGTAASIMATTTDQGRAAGSFGFTTRSPYSPSNLAASATSLDLGPKCMVNPPRRAHHFIRMFFDAVFGNTNAASDRINAKLADNFG
jgi:hypothetical protein